MKTFIQYGFSPQIWPKNLLNKWFYFLPLPLLPIFSVAHILSILCCNHSCKLCDGTPPQYDKKRVKFRPGSEIFLGFAQETQGNPKKNEENSYSILWKTNTGFLTGFWGFGIFLDRIFGDFWRILGVIFGGFLEAF